MVMCPSCLALQLHGDGSVPYYRYLDAAVYYFCGSQLQYCTCDFRWNLLGWCKALVLWNFVLTAALGAQRLAILIGLDGLLPGAAAPMQLPTQSPM